MLMTPHRSFLAQAPLCTIAWLAVYFVLDVPRPDQSHWLQKIRKVDFLGALVLVLAVVALLVGLDSGSNLAGRTSSPSSPSPSRPSSSPSSSSSRSASPRTPSPPATSSLTGASSPATLPTSSAWPASSASSSSCRCTSRPSSRIARPSVARSSCRPWSLACWPPSGAVG